ncbi:hypothetical protein SEUCBS140593_007327 [Sporothrix eucalyptigena]|uniref:Asteroid domain-containing protein n=1 Tax=Sporothrix eucalyptigena TaxID=1812306 RepID=A0ABP0CF09_9PEZI
MGVPKLLSTLTPYGDRKPLDNARLIIDGPALAYHVVGLCMADPVMAAARSHPLEQPSYGQLGQAAIAWLDGLRARSVTIQALFFDGYLPEAKRPVRLERSYRTSAQLKDVFVFYQRANLPGFDVKGPRTGSLLPAPAFAVPAVLDALRESLIYGPLTTVVPGEADTFCAEYARTHGGGTVITSDSDLLVQDLGPDAAVVLFRDIDLPRRLPATGNNDANTPPKPLVVPTYEVATICRRLGLPPHGDDDNFHKGLYGFAFELSMDPHLITSELVDRTKQGVAVAKYPQEYAEFVEQYAYPDRIVAAVKQYDITGLDPRVSELVLQCLYSDAKSPVKEPKPIFAFSPPLLDSCTKTNAWEASAPIRACAYSLLRIVASTRQMGNGVREYSRMASMASRGSELDMIPLSELGAAMDAILNLLQRIRGVVVDDVELQWVTLASYRDIQWSKENTKESVFLEVLRQETPGSGVMERVTWNAVHWLAQIQATLYSLRILQQIATFVQRQVSSGKAAGGEALLTKLAALAKALSTVTSLPDYPTLRTLQNLPMRLKAAGALQLLGELADLPEPITFKTSSSKKNRNKNKKRKRTDQAPARVQTMTNPFAILDNSE